MSKPRSMGGLGWTTVRADLPDDTTNTPEVSIFEISIDDILVPETMRPVDEDTVDGVVASVTEIGLQAQGIVTVEWAPAGAARRAVLISGRHRLEAFRRLGWKTVPCAIFDGSADEAELWRISENLHSKELTALERAEAIARWLQLRAEKGAQDAHVSGGRGHRGGISAAADELGIDRRTIQRGLQVAGLAAEAKTEAQRLGLADDQFAMLTAAHAGGATEQIASLHETIEKSKAAQQRRERENARLRERYKDCDHDIDKLMARGLQYAGVSPRALRLAGGDEPAHDRIGAERCIEELATELERDDPATVVERFAPDRLEQIAAAVEKLPGLLDRLKPELEKRLASRQKPSGPTVH